jgi:hypothetical protein
MKKLEDLFVYYEVDEELGNGYHASILQDKSGKRHDSKIELDSADDLILGKMKEAVIDGVDVMSKDSY